MNLLLVFAGAGLGGVARYSVGNLIARGAGMAFPYGTLGVNILGGFVLGLMVGLWAMEGASNATRLFWVVGFLGGFTTFSAFTLESYAMLQNQQFASFAAYTVASVAGAMLALVLGMVLGRYFTT